MFIYRRLTSCFKSISVNRILGQTTSSGIAIIYIQRSYANRILQVSIDRIIDVFGKRKNSEPFMRFVRFNCFVIYLVKKIGSVALIVLILYKQHCVGFHILLRFNRVMVKKSYFKNLC